MKHQDTPHVESVNIGDKEFIKLPPSVDQDPSTKRSIHKEQNQYILQGAKKTFNADSFK